MIPASQLFALAQQLKESADGFAIRFLNEPGRFMVVAKFIENEWLCCPFFHFGLEVESNSGSLWLQLKGGEGVKEILQTTLFESIVDRVALKPLIQTGATAIIMKHYPNH